MIISALLAIAMAMQANTSAEADPDTRLLNDLLSPQKFEELQQQARAWCASSRLPTECHLALLAASYSQINVEVCWERVGERYPHGGPIAHDEMRTTCHQATRLCRENWTYFVDLAARVEPAWNERQRERLRQAFVGNCGTEASEIAQDR